MTEPSQPSELMAEAAFSKQAVVFDDLYGSDKIIAYKRWRVRSVLMACVGAGHRVLELNCGTGEDAIWLAQQGCAVHATDISVGMQDVLNEKKSFNFYPGSITQELCSYTQLDQLQERGPFDCVFSNFAGLNCTDQLDKVIGSFDRLLAPGGSIVLVLMPSFCIWETALLFRGKFRTATRRWFSQNGAPAKVENVPFTCWYYDAGYVKKLLRKHYELITIEGLCTIVPPSYMEGFGDRYPKLFNALKWLENKLRYFWPWRTTGDYYIIHAIRK